MSANKHFKNDELLDVVNDNDEVLHQRYRSDIYASGDSNFRVINAFIMNDEGLLWIPRRSPEKKLFPLCLDASVGGHVKSGETYQQAFTRELQEELNLDSSKVSYSFIAYLNPGKNNVSAHMHVYVIYYNKTPNFNTDDFVSSVWITISDLQKCIRQGDRTKGDLPILVDLLDTFIQTLK